MKRIIARLDIKNEHLIKGIHLEGLRKLGDPNKFAMNYYQQGADELVFMDAVASLYGRNNLANIIENAAKNVFIPITVGGGVRSVEDAQILLNSGADKVALNTAAIARPELIKEMALRFGSQCVVLSVEAKKQNDGSWEVFTDNGRERTGKDVIEWVKQAAELGAGEVLLTSIDKEGTRKGFDIELTQRVSSAVTIPVIASGGAGEIKHISEILESGGADALAVADILHYERETIGSIKSALESENHKNAVISSPDHREKNVTIIDYGMGNLLSVKRACEASGATVKIVSSKNDILEAKRLILPGVGAFKNGMKELKERQFDAAIIKAAQSGVPILGICLGMQMLFDKSNEHGVYKGLGLIAGDIVPIKTKKAKIPLIGWHKLHLQHSDSLLSKSQDHLMYFVHSYYAKAKNSSDITAIIEYDGAEITASVKHKNIYGMQFHPEKSGVNGLQIINNFLAS